MKRIALCMQALRLPPCSQMFSFRIRRLEKDLGVTLFVRLRRGVKPTREGDLLYRYAKDILGKVEEARDRVRNLSTA